MHIEEIIIFDEENEIKLNSKETKKFLFLTSVDFKKNILKVIKKRPEYSKDVLLIFLEGVIRKVFKKIPAIPERRVLNRVRRDLNLNKIKKIGFILDNKKEIYFEVTDFHIYNLMGDIIGIIEKNQYNIDKKSVKDKTILDCGAHHGVFSTYCATLDAKKIFAFEPLKSTFKILKKNISINNLDNKIFPINMAVGEKNSEGKIFFENIADGAASLNKKQKKYDTIKIIKIDDFINKKRIKKVGIIKMDIEGNEEKALIGAKKTIQKHKPILTFSAYHKKDDKIKLPRLVKSIREDYNIRLLNNFEEDFYCY